MAYTGFASSGNPYPLTNPPFYVISDGYDMDIITSGISFGKMSYPCHIHVISVFQKRYIWIYLVYPKLKKLHLVYTWYIFSCHMPCLSMSYPCHKFVRLSCAGQQMKFSRKLHCGSSLAYHCTAFIKHNKIYLPPPRARKPPLPPALGGDAAGAGSCAPADPRQRGGRWLGGRRRRGLLVGGVRRRGVRRRMGLLGSVR